ncbi:hypothetical protein NC651_018164 [Populus alba x Populus x berolinensis]|nr:hypothetical protein NC651_018164 [Populus alba x Populus x berolinensis]
MAPSTTRLVLPTDLKKQPWEQKLPIHNRWSRNTTGCRGETVDWTGGMIEDDDSAVDVKTIDLSTVHYLNLSIRVLDKEGNPAKPGDPLAVEICKLFGILKEYMPIRLKYHQQGDKVYLTTDIENTMVFLTDVSFAVHVKEGFLEKSILLMLGRPLQSQLTAICDQDIRLSERIMC